MSLDLRHGDSLIVLRTLPDASVDSIVTDPPYELGFMGKSWDSTGIAYNVALWRECLRVLRPGGHLLAFGGTRTYHRMACAIEDAGFEIRDQLQWIYATGFPKSLDVSKAIDNASGAERERLPAQVRASASPALHTSGFGSPSWSPQVSTPATDAARPWQGWGTALKPANEPICMARKPLSETTVAANVLRHGTGALHVDAGRIPTDETWAKQQVGSRLGIVYSGGRVSNPDAASHPLGRWPANVLFDESAAAELDRQSGEGRERPSPPSARQNGVVEFGLKRSPGSLYTDGGGASRFFYVAKPCKSERNFGCDDLPERPPGALEGSADGSLNKGRGVPVNRNIHPTVKPVRLMGYLIALVTPAGGLVLDPFLGSGTTGMAAVQGGFGFIGIEQSAEYLDIARARIGAG